MRKPMAKKVLAATMAAAMTMSFAACADKTPATTSEPASTPASVEPASTSEEDPGLGKYTVLRDKDGNIYDLGGAEIVIRDWFAPAEVQEAKTEYEEEQRAYQEWAQETYNFKVTNVAIGDWGTVAQDFVDYCTAGNDDTNYVFCMPNGFMGTLISAIDQDLVYDLSTLDCLDFNDTKYALNHLHDLFTFGDSVYAMHSGMVEPRTGMYFNKRLLEEAGIDPMAPYDMQANGTWTWEAFEDMLKTVQQDTDNDGTTDIWGITLNEGVMVTAAVFSNGGKFIGKENGQYTYNFDDAETVQALEWVKNIFDTYDWNGPNDEEGNPPSWDYYQQQFKAGGAAFLCDQQYCATPGNLFADMEDELGFVMFPAGPKGSLTHCAEDNIYCIPGFYDADRAWKCAFAYNLYYDLVPGYEDYNPYINTTLTGNFDPRTAETVELMAKGYDLNFIGTIPAANQDFGPQFSYSFYPGMATISEILDGCRTLFQTYVDEANQ